MFTNEEGKEEYELREFGTFTNDLIELRDWLLKKECLVVAIESTGVYWRPVYNVLEGHVFVTLINARHYKNVPGKKTDVRDCRWLAGLLRYGLLRGSFIPPQDVRDWRDLTKIRKNYVETVGDFKRRTHKLFETANIKIDSVVSDLFGVSGRNLMDFLCRKSVKNIKPDQIAECLRGRLKKKDKELCRAMQGFFRPHHGEILKSYLRSIKSLEKEIERLEARLKKLTASHQDLLERLDEIPGVDQKAAIAIIAQVGLTLTEFPTAAHLASWCGLCPGSNESAGKRKSGRSPVHGHDLKTLLVEVAWAAVHTKGTHYREKYFRLKSRRGAKRAIVALAHRLAKVIFNIIKYGVRYQELGANYLVELTEQAALKRLHKQAEKYGYQLVAKEAATV